MVVAVVAFALVGLAYDCADACAGGSADDGTFEAAAEDGAEDGSAACADERTFSGTNSALIAAVIVVVAVVVVILAAATAVAHPIIEVGVSVPVVLGADGEETCSQQERGDEYSLAYLHHARLDAGSVGHVRIFSWAGCSTRGWGTFCCKVFIL
jgi:hypothetical protein